MGCQIYLRVYHLVSISRASGCHTSTNVWEVQIADDGFSLGGHKVMCKGKVVDLGEGGEEHGYHKVFCDILYMSMCTHMYIQSSF